MSFRSTASQTADLRALTGAGYKACYDALIASVGDMDKAQDILHQQGVERGKNRQKRTSEGAVFSYIHHDGRIGSIVELNCETDFVARTDDFKRLGNDLAMHIASDNPAYFDIVPLSFGEERFVKDPSITVEDLINGVAAKVGETIRVKRFQRFEVGT